MLQRAPRDFGNGAGHFHAGGAAADNDEGQEPRLLGFVLDHFGALEGEEKAPPDLGRVRDVLESRRERRPIVVAEIGMRRAGGEHEIVVRQIEFRRVDAVRRDVDGGHLRHDHADVFLAADDGADRPRDIARRQRRGRHLIEQRLEAVMILRVDQRHVGVRPRKRATGFQPAEASADDHHLRALVRLLHALLGTIAHRRYLMTTFAGSSHFRPRLCCYLFCI